MKNINIKFDNILDLLDAWYKRFLISKRLLHDIVNDEIRKNMPVHLKLKKDNSVTIFHLLKIYKKCKSIKR